jgi:triosephosphate isomerase (TIM)
MGTSTRSVPGRSGPARPSPADRPALGDSLFILNLKTYPATLGSRALRIGRLLTRMGARARIPVALAPALPDVGYLADKLSLPIMAQYVDPVDAGQRTGSVPSEALRAAGASGSLINHSEHPLATAGVGAAVARLKAAGLTAVVCARSVGQARRLAAFRPPYLAVEPPELIGGTVSVSSARPGVISGTVTAVRRVSPSTRVLCGAGIHDRHDVARAIELGSRGILVASAVARSPDPAAAIAELLRGFSPVPPGPRNSK